MDALSGTIRADLKIPVRVVKITKTGAYKRVIVETPDGRRVDLGEGSTLIVDASISYEQNQEKDQ